MILEGIVTTLDENGRLNVAPMGPIVDKASSVDWNVLRLRPFRTSQTFVNLTKNPQGVFHVTDDAMLFALGVLQGITEDLAPTAPARVVAGRRLVDCCRSYEFVVEHVVEDELRPTFFAKVVHQERIRDFWGFNRAKHAVIEAAILVSRRRLTGAGDILAELDRLRIIVEKTGGDSEFRAFALLEQAMTG